MPTTVICFAVVLCCCSATTSTQRRENAAVPARPEGTASDTVEPRDVRDCLQHLEQAHALVRSGGDRAKTLTALRQLTTTIRGLRRQDLAANDKVALAKCEEKAAETLRGAAGSWTKPAEAGQLLAKEALEQIVGVYQLYLETFPGGEAAYRFAYFRAQVLFQLNRWAEAGKAYDQIVKLAVPKGDTDNRLTAALAAVVAWKKAFAAVNVSKDRRGLPPEGRQLVAAIDTFLVVAPNTPERVSLRYSQARAYYRFGQVNSAARIFAEIATQHPRHELATTAAQLLLDSLNAQKKHAEMHGWVKRLLGIKPLARGTLLEHLRKIDRGLRAMAAEKLSEQRKFRECGEAYERLMRDFPRDPQWIYAAYNGAVCFENAQLPSRALSLRRQLVSHAPTSPLARKVLAHVCARPEGRRVRWWRSRCR